MKVSRFFCPIILICAFMLTACGSSNPKAQVNARPLGEQAYAVKTLDGLFFQQGDTTCLISGTEVTEGSDSQLFIYDTTENRMICTQTLENTCSMTAFCDADSLVFVATISRDAAVGCDLYAYNKADQSVSHCAHFSGKGIYGLAYDGASTIYVAVSQPAGLYAYNIQTSQVMSICQNITSQPYLRTMAYLDGICYLGVGSEAALIAVDTETGQYEDILPQGYSEESFVYDLAVMDGTLYAGLSPSSTVLAFDPQSEEFQVIKAYRNCSAGVKN